MCLSKWGKYKNWFEYSSNIPSSYTITSLAVLDSCIFASTPNGDGIYKSTNYGVNWLEANNGLTDKFVYCLEIYGRTIIAGTHYNNIFISSDKGNSWTSVNQGIWTNSIVHSICVANNYIFAGTYGNSQWRRPLSEIIEINNISSEVPIIFSLSQNYPNPFNPTTNIKFDLPKSTYSKLIIYDALGRDVETFINEKLKEGSYQVDWNASQYPSGCIFIACRQEILVIQEKWF